MMSRTAGRLRAAFVLLSLLPAAGASPLVAGSSPSAAQEPVALQGDAGRGAVLYDDYTCYGCHGTTGEVGVGPRLNPPRLRQGQFIAYLRNPPNPRRMPPYRQAEVSDQNLADIYSFLESLPSTSPEAEDIPVLRELLQATPR